MIWNLDTPGRSGRDSVHEHVRNQLLGHLGDRMRVPEALDEVAAAVATAWQQDFHGVPLPPASLSLMAARVMWGVGEPETAKALMQGVAGEAGEAQTLVDLVESGGPSLSACVGLGAGVLRPVRSAMGGQGPCWVLDPVCLTTSAGHLAELGLPDRIRRILSRTAEIWDGHAGEGVLGIARPGPRNSPHLARLVREEVPGLCRAVLARIQRERGWSRYPDVCRLGL